MSADWWSSTTELDELTPSWVDALGQFEDRPRDRVADAGTYKYGYTDLAGVAGHARAVLRAHDLAVHQIPQVDEREVSVTTVVWHKSGQRLVFPPFRLPAGGSVQQIGSSLTYARRYALLAVLGLATEDDDGQAAAEVKPTHLTQKEGKWRLTEILEGDREWAAKVWKTLNRRAGPVTPDELAQIETAGYAALTERKDMLAQQISDIGRRLQYSAPALLAVVHAVTRRDDVDDPARDLTVPEQQTVIGVLERLETGVLELGVDETGATVVREVAT